MLTPGLGTKALKSRKLLSHGREEASDRGVIEAELSLVGICKLKVKDNWER